MSRLADAWGKLQRANKHAGALHREVCAFRDSKAVRIAHGGDLEAGDYFFWVNLSEEPPLREWGLTVGDVIHNLHSALDCLAWQLTLIGPKGEPTEAEAKSIYFPIMRSLTAFRDHATLRHVTCTHRDMLQEVQPYQRGYGSLMFLRELSKRDKHRAIQPVYLIDDGFRLKTEAFSDCEITDTEYFAAGPLEHERKLARIQGRATGPEPKLDGKAKLSGKVTLSDGTPLQELLDEIVLVVAGILHEFEPTLSGVLL
jgi:hypothetical protein